ncbi:MAG: aspartate 1-decarboxylase [Omnitrophica bacterium RIFCSPHIGHO2_02_FULL_49_9]|nr:MAG: aspartate 1-decarboxylase [Omnitrophica bacterium RIFCSPHIGHO2_02_FULL_49_9]
MIRQLLKSKIHRATVTEANVDYEGSITIDEKLMDAAKLVEWEKVLIANLSNGSRVESYAIAGAWGSGVICANGGAAIHNKVGDTILIMSFCGVEEKEIKRHRPRVVKVDRQNRIIP